MTETTNTYEQRLEALREEIVLLTPKPSKYDIRIAENHARTARPFVDHPTQTVAFSTKELHDHVMTMAISLLHLEVIRLHGTHPFQEFKMRKEFYEEFTEKRKIYKTQDESIRQCLGNFMSIDRAPVKFVSNASLSTTPTIATLPEFVANRETVDPDDEFFNLWSYTTPTVTNAYYRLHPFMVDKYLPPEAYQGDEDGLIKAGLVRWLSQGVDFYMILPNLPVSMWTYQ